VDVAGGAAPGTSSVRSPSVVEVAYLAIRLCSSRYGRSSVGEGAVWAARVTSAVGAPLERGGAKEETGCLQNNTDKTVIKIVSDDFRNQLFTWRYGPCGVVAMWSSGMSVKMVCDHQNVDAFQPEAEICAK